MEKTLVLKKNVEDEEVEYEEIEVDEELSRRGRHKKVLDIEINFRDYFRRGEGQIGRGGSRGCGSNRNERGGERDDSERGDRGANRERGGGRGQGDRQFYSRNRRQFRSRDSKEQSAGG